MPLPLSFLLFFLLLFTLFKFTYEPSSFSTYSSSSVFMYCSTKKLRLEFKVTFIRIKIKQSDSFSLYANKTSVYLPLKHKHVERERQVKAHYYEKWKNGEANEINSFSVNMQPKSYAKKREVQFVIRSFVMPT